MQHIDLSKACEIVAMISVERRIEPRRAGALLVGPQTHNAASKVGTRGAAAAAGWNA